MYSIRVKLDLSEDKRTVLDNRTKKEESKIVRWRKGERTGERIRAGAGGGGVGKMCIS